MYDLFQTVVTLSLLGGGLTAVLLCLKPITAKRFPVQWQYAVWLVALLSMLLPAYKLIPIQETNAVPPIAQTQAAGQESPAMRGESTETARRETTPIQHREVTVAPNRQMRLSDLLTGLWVSGTCLYLAVVIVSYIHSLLRQRENAVLLTDHAILDDIKKKLKITRQIPLRMSPDIQSPMLVGVLFPAIYLPCQEIPDENLCMVFLHELTHYKRKDLLLKWLALFVNAVHWFNPLAYLLRSNISEACEAACDRAVTRAMSPQERKQYMATILSLAET